MGRSSVIGQTGKVVLSDSMMHYKRNKKRTIRYRSVKCASGHLAEVIGPPDMMGLCSYGAKPGSAKKALARRLANDHGYFGNMILSD